MQSPDARPAVLAFDDVEIDLDARRLRRGGVAVALEPKAFAVLQVMLERPGHAFTRDELLDAVWGHRHLTPGVLVRVVGLIRRALGDEDERHLQTVHGVGYRLVIEAQASPAPAGAGTTAPAGIAPGPPAIGWRTGWRLPAAVLLVLAFTGPDWRGSPTPQVPIGQALAGPGAAAMPTLAVLPLRALGDAARGQEFADGLSEELITALARIDGLRVSARSASFPYREAGLPLADVADRLGATHVLEGSVRQDAGRLRIALRLVDVGADRAVWSERFDRAPDDIFAVQDEIAGAVADVLRLRFVLAGEGPAEDPALYRRFLVARQATLHAEADDDDFAVAAIAALQAMAEEHPTYARAWGGLAALQFERSLRPRPDREALLAEAERYAARALALDPAQPDALAVISGQACREQRWQECLAQTRRIVRLSPSEVGTRLRLAMRLATMGYVEDGLAEAREAAAIDPNSAMVRQVTGRLLDTLGRHDEANALFERTTFARSYTARVLNALWRGDLADARRLAGSLAPDNHWRASMLATIDALEDPVHWPRAIALIEASERTPQPEGGLVDYNFMRLWLPERDFARDVAGLDRTQRVGFATYQLVFWQPQSRALRRHPAFRAYVRDSGLLALWRREGWPATCRPAGGDDFRCD